LQLFVAVILIVPCHSLFVSAHLLFFIIILIISVNIIIIIAIGVVITFIIAAVIFIINIVNSFATGTVFDLMALLEEQLERTPVCLHVCMHVVFAFYA
jgi:hypothetical protein